MSAFISSQIFIGLSATIYATSLLLKSKKTLLFFQIISSIFFTIHYFLLNAFIGGFIAILETLRTVIFYFIDKYYNHSKTRITASIIFIIIGCVSSIFTWKAWFSILPLLGLIAVSVCLAFKNVLLLKISCVFSAICAFIYMLFLNSIFGAITQIFITIIGLIGIISLIVKNNKKDSLKETILKNNANMENNNEQKNI